MKNLSLVIILCSFLNACSFSSSSKEDVTSRPSDELEFAVDTLSDTGASLEDVKVEEQPVVEAEVPDQMSPPDEVASMVASEISETSSGMEKEMPAIEEPKFSDFKKAAVSAKTSDVEMKPVIEKYEQPSFSAKADSPVQIVESKVDDPSKLGAIEKYHVQKGDTLMMVAFKIYGDYRKWKDLKEWNKGQLPKKIAPGVVLKYHVPGQSFGWKPSGMPYMVKSGDTLGVISLDKYGTYKKWKSIYENNRPLIRDPNLIFAGFTIYYMPTRNVASKNR